LELPGDLGIRTERSPGIAQLLVVQNFHLPALLRPAELRGELGGLLIALHERTLDLLLIHRLRR
jgi:hypothetical protein